MRMCTKRLVTVGFWPVAVCLGCAPAPRNGVSGVVDAGTEATDTALEVSLPAPCAPPGPVPIAAGATQLSSLPAPANGARIVGRDAGYSARFQGKSAWIYGDTFTGPAPRDGMILTNTWSWTADTDASDGIGPFAQSVDADGVPVQVVPYDAQGYEYAFNAFHKCTQDDHAGTCLACGAKDSQCGSRVALWPGPVVAYSDASGVERALILYEKLIIPFDGKQPRRVGTSVARWDDPTQPALRAAGELFPATDPGLTAGAVSAVDPADGKRYLYAYGCDVARSAFAVAPCSHHVA